MPLLISLQVVYLKKRKAYRSSIIPDKFTKSISSLPQALDTCRRLPVRGIVDACRQTHVSHLTVKALKPVHAKGRSVIVFLLLFLHVNECSGQINKFEMEGAANNIARVFVFQMSCPTNSPSLFSLWKRYYYDSNTTSRSS
jgi:hypothetical protein